jgi:SAM-dependent methyltransferase
MKRRQTSLDTRLCIVAALTSMLPFVEAGLYTRLSAQQPSTSKPANAGEGPSQVQGRPPRRLFPPIDLGLLESPDRAEWQKPEQIMDVLHIADGSTVADIGAGAGWFTIRLARRVGPNGIVYSQDVQREMLEAIRRRVSREGLQNVRTRLGEGSDPNLLVMGLDAIVVVDAYQEVEDRVTFLQNLARALKPNGLIGVVNWKPGRGGPGPPENARVDKASVTSDVRAAGLRIVDEEMLPYQYMLVLAK